MDQLMGPTEQNELLELLGGNHELNAEQFKRLIMQLDSQRVLAKVFLLEGTPFVFKHSPMKYIIFKEQVADRFEIGSQDVCIVGSAKLGFSPSPHKGNYGKPFSETSDVDVVVISDELFDLGTRELFKELSFCSPSIFVVRNYLEAKATPKPDVDLEDWRKIKDAIKNYTYQNFNPGNLSGDHPLRISIFERISSTDGLFLALEPKVFVSKIRCRVFRTWKAAEDYYANSLREVKKFFKGDVSELEAYTEEPDDSSKKVNEVVMPKKESVRKA